MNVGPGRLVPALALALAALGPALPARGDEAEAIARALAYLGREVPAWPREHRCFSCHNNGDAARALYEAARLGRDVPGPATAATDAWLARPDGWDRNGGDGPFSDKVLARVAFAAGLAAADAAGRAEGGRAALVAAARRLARDQADDGAWRVDPADAIGSPATYGRPLATWLAVDALRRADPAEFAPELRRARAWLARVESINTPGAAVVLLAAGDDPDLPAPMVAAALGYLRIAQDVDGGWGPFRSAPAEAFDTALGVLALSRHRDRPGVLDELARGRAYLVAAQGADGSWPETTRPPNGESYAQRLSTAGWATLALLASAPRGAARDVQPSPPHVTPVPAAGPPPPPGSEITMADPRNIAHDKKVQEEKKHAHEPIGPDNAAVAPQPGRKTPTVHEKPHEEATSTHATSQHHHDRHTGHVEEPPAVQAELDAKEDATDRR